MPWDLGFSLDFKTKVVMLMSNVKARVMVCYHYHCDFNSRVIIAFSYLLSEDKQSLKLIPGPVRQIRVKEMIRKLEENPGNSRNFKTDRKPQTPRKSQTGNKVKEFKRLPQQAASPGKITRVGGSIKQIQKIGSPMLPDRKTFKKQKANLISSNMGRGLFVFSKPNQFLLQREFQVRNVTD
jgi:hypothetical protein